MWPIKLGEQQGGLPEGGYRVIAPCP